MQLKFMLLAVVVPSLVSVCVQSIPLGELYPHIMVLVGALLQQYLMKISLSQSNSPRSVDPQRTEHQCAMGKCRSLSNRWLPLPPANAAQKAAVDCSNHLTQRSGC